MADLSPSVRFAAVALACILLAGCSGKQSEQSAPRALQERGAINFQDPVESNDPCPLLDCDVYITFEPTLAVSEAGMLTSIVFGGLSRSPDGGQTFHPVPYPGLITTQTREQFWYASDALLQTGPDGAIWFSSLRMDNDPETHSTGLYVAKTFDAGLSWDNERSITIQGNTNFPTDRQWLAFGPERMLLSFQAADDEGYVLHGRTMVSSDGGDTWQGPFDVTATGKGDGHGAPIWSEGQFMLPYWSDGDVMVAKSANGEHWRHQVVARSLASHLPAAASSGGHVWLAWRTGDDAMLLVAESGDNGQTWTEPLRLSSENETVVGSPWIQAADGAAIVAYYAVQSDSTVTLHVDRIHQGAVDRGVAAAGLPDEKWTDFAYFALYGTSIWAIYPDGDDSVNVVRGA